MKEILRDRRASSFPMTIGIVLSLIILMCGISEYFRLQVIAAGVREAVEDAVISTVNDNYAGVYHGVREGYSGSYVPFGEGSWEEDLNEGDIYDYLDETIGTQLSGARGAFRSVTCRLSMANSIAVPVSAYFIGLPPDNRVPMVSSR